MYRYEKKESKAKQILITVLLMIIASVVSIYIYKMYSNIKIGGKTEVENMRKSRTFISRNRRRE